MDEQSSATCVKQAFNDPPHPVRILLATDAAAEGLNLQQTARYLLHFDCPWNPSKLEQRNGRIDRHGQARDVTVHHFVTDQDQDLALPRARDPQGRRDPRGPGLGQRAVRRGRSSAPGRWRERREPCRPTSTGASSQARGRAAIEADATIDTGAEGRAAERPARRRSRPRSTSTPTRCATRSKRRWRSAPAGRSSTAPTSRADLQAREPRPARAGARSSTNRSDGATGAGSRGPVARLAFSAEPFLDEDRRAPRLLPAARRAADAPLASDAAAGAVRAHAPALSGTGEEVSRWTVRLGGVPPGADALVLLSVEELAVNDLRETFHHWVRTLVFPIRSGALGEPLAASTGRASCARPRRRTTPRTTTRARDLLDEVDAGAASASSAAHAEQLDRHAATASSRRAASQARKQEEERYRSRQGEVSTLIAENTLAKLEREIEKLKARARSRGCSSTRSAARRDRPLDRREAGEIARRTRHYEEVREQLERERERILKHLLPQALRDVGAGAGLPGVDRGPAAGRCAMSAAELVGWDRLRHGGLLLDAAAPAPSRRARPATRCRRTTSASCAARAAAVLDGGARRRRTSSTFVLEEVCGFTLGERHLAARLAGRRRVGPPRGHRRDGQAAPALARRATARCCPCSSTTRRASASAAAARPRARSSSGCAPAASASRSSPTAGSGGSSSPASTSTRGASGTSTSGSRRARSRRRSTPCARCSRPRCGRRRRRTRRPRCCRRSSTAARARRSSRPSSASACARPSSCSCRRTARSLKERCADVDPADIYRAAVRVVMRMVVVLFAESRELLPRDNAALPRRLRPHRPARGAGEGRPRAAATVSPARGTPGRACSRCSGSSTRARTTRRCPCRPTAASCSRPATRRRPTGSSRALAVFETACFDQRAAPRPRRAPHARAHHAHAREGAPGPRQHLGARAGRLLRPLERVHRHPLRGPARLRAEDRAGRRPGRLPRRRQPAGAAALAPRGDGRQGARQPAREDEGHEQRTTTTRSGRGATEDGEATSRRPRTEEDAEARRGRAPTEPTHGEPMRTTSGTPRARAPRPGRAARSRSASSRASREGALTPEKRLAYEDAVARKARQLVVARRPARRVVPRALGRHAQGLGHLLHAPGPRRADGAAHAAAARLHAADRRRRRARRRRAARRVDAEDARGDPRAQGLRPGLRLGHLPGRRAAVPDRRALRLAAPSRPHRRPTATAPSCDCSTGAHAAAAPEERLGQELLPCRPDDALFEPRLKAVLRRYVVERCIYGVDLDPLAVELCRLALWIETMDRTLPFSFLDHKVKCGNALVGAGSTSSSTTR